MPTHPATVRVDRLMLQRFDLYARRLSELAAEGKALPASEVAFQALMLRPIWDREARV